MKNRFIFVLASLAFISLGAMTATQAVKAESLATCPDTVLNETSEDCPWAGAARTLYQVQQEARPLLPAFKDLAPQIESQISRDSGKPFLKLWGKSINFDELAQGTIVQPELLDLMADLIGVAPRKERIVHAGMEHTYGYLFSVLKTPYGYKRARWVRPEIEVGFGLPSGTLSPLPSEGTLLSNVSYFAGKIAFRSDRLSNPFLKSGEKFQVASALVNFPYAYLKIIRMEETLRLKGTKKPGSKVVLRTDLVPFPVQPEVKTANTHLLVYSIQRGIRFELISAFPVQDSFVTGVVNPDKLGTDQPIITRYNAYIERVTGVSPPLKGTRKISDPVR